MAVPSYCYGTALRHLRVQVRSHAYYICNLFLIENRQGLTNRSVHSNGHSVWTESTFGTYTTTKGQKGNCANIHSSIVDFNQTNVSKFFSLHYNMDENFTQLILKKYFHSLAPQRLICAFVFIFFYIYVYIAE